MIDCTSILDTEDEPENMEEDESTVAEIPLQVPVYIPGNCVIVEFKSKKTTKKFVGIVLDKDNDDYEVQFLKSVNSENTIFTLNENDVSWIKSSDLIKETFEFKITRRGLYEFKKSLNVSG
jgi:hypothetical protein